MGAAKKIGRPRLGHIVIDGVPFKHCSQCDYWMTLNEFSKKSEAWDGKRTVCKECINKQEKIYRQENRDREYARTRQWFIQNIEKAKAYHKKWESSNKHKRKTYTQNRRARLSGLPNTLTPEQWGEIKEKFNYSCAYCGKSDCELEQDHFIPLTKDTRYGTSIQNIIPCCQFCNRSKCNKDFEEWYPMQDFYSDERKEFILNHLRTMGYKEVV